MSSDSISGLSGSLRVSGLSSGLDTEAIVESMLQYNQTKIDKQNQEITKLEWKSEAFRDINLSIRNFRETYMSVLSPDSNMLTSSAYNSFDVTMLDASSAVSVEAGATSMAGMMTINSITQLAQAAEAESIGIFSTDEVSLNTALIDLDLTTAMTFVDNEISFSVNGEEFTFSEDALLSEVISTVNASDAGVTMRYSSLKKGLTVAADETGADSTVEIVNIKGNAFDATASSFGIAEGTYTGQDAILEIENISVTKSTNSFSIDGIAYTLRDTSAQSISFNVERNVQSTVDRITSFVDAYNELAGSLQDTIDEELHYAYDPLTDSERENLTESQAEKWEDLAKSGLLRNDSNISGLLAKLRESFYTAVESAGLSPSEIGLTTGTYDNKGKIYVNKDILTQAVQNNPEKVESIFVNASQAEDSSTKFSESGLINRMSDLFNNYIKNATFNTISNNDSALARAEARLEDLEASYASNEERYWAKYTAMETALATMNSQISSLLSAMGYSASAE